MIGLFNNRQNKIILSILIPFLLLFSGCAMFKKLSGQQQQDSGQEQSEKIPEQLKTIESTTEKIFLSLGGPVELSNNQAQGQDQEQNQQGQQGQQNKTNGQEQSQDQQGQNEQVQGKNQTVQENQPKNTSGDPWQQLAADIESLHLAWNNYLPEAAKKGAKKDLLDAFSSALNNLTGTLETKDKNKMLLAANDLSGKIPDLYALYQTKISPEIKRLIYYSRVIILTGTANNWEKSAAGLKEMQSVWAVARSTLGQEQEADISKIELSIYELQKALKGKNKNIVEIKGKIVLSNISRLQKKLEENNP